MENVGVRPADQVVVRFYAGDPEQGGRRLAEVTLDAPLAPGGSAMVSGTTDTLSAQPVTIYAVADPENRLDECDEANNSRGADAPAVCQVP